jgi:hypothetical protein
LGYPAPKTSDAYRGRQLLNADTIREMHAAFRVGGRAAIDKVMKNQPAIFLKLLDPWEILVWPSGLSRRPDWISALSGSFQ